jgi:hypothetical protein
VLNPKPGAGYKAAGQKPALFRRPLLRRFSAGVPASDVCLGVHRMIARSMDRARRKSQLASEIVYEFIRKIVLQRLCIETIMGRHRSLSALSRAQNKVEVTTA